MVSGLRPGRLTKPDDVVQVAEVASKPADGRDLERSTARAAWPATSGSLTALLRQGRGLSAREDAGYEEGFGALGFGLWDEREPVSGGSALLLRDY